MYSTVQEYISVYNLTVYDGGYHTCTVLFRKITMYKLTISDGGYYTCTVLFRNITVYNLTISDEGYFTIYIHSTVQEYNRVQPNYIG